MTPSEAAGIVAPAIAREVTTSQAADAAMTALRQIADNPGIGEFLRAARDDAAAAGCAAQSYRHPLGFESIMLIDKPPEFRLRLHAWWPDDVPGMEHVHNHRFMLATVVLLGGYDMQIYQLGHSGIPMDEYSEHSGQDGESWSLDYVGTARLRLLASTFISTGSGYALTTDALHRVKVPHGRLCVTLSLAAPAAPATHVDTHVFASPGGAAPARSWKRPFSLAGYQRRLDSIAAELSPA
jgi:hypothetical protein